MSIYLANYWSLYREFVETFQQLKFRDIPIVLLTNFYQQIDQELKVKMENKDFQTHVKLPKMNQEMIQPYFEKWLDNIRIPINMHNPDNGKVLINADYTRIPELTYQNLFDPKRTIILARSKKSHLYGIPIEIIGNYEPSTNKASVELEKEAKYIFETCKNHPAFGNEYFQRIFLTRIPLIVNRISSVFNLFDKLNISSIVVGTTEDMLSRALSIVGSMRGIKSICLQHGILMGEEAFMPVFTTNVAVYGDYEKSWYFQRGLTQERIAEIGHPKYDEIFMDFPINRKDFLHAFGFNDTKLTLLVITGPNIDHNKFTKLIKNMLDSQRFQILIKPHPWEMGKGKYGIYLDLEKEYKSIKVYTSRDNTLYKLISHVDGVVSSLSTVVLESVLLNKPVFIYNFLQSNRSYDYFNKFRNHIQTDPNSLTDVITTFYSSNDQKQIYDTIRRQYLSESYNNGSSGEKLVQFLNHNS